MNQPVVFERTRAGKVGKFNFYDVPLVWVEGDDDVVFYGKLLNGNCRIEAANGRDECMYLAAELVAHDHPYCVIMDGDYGVLTCRSVPHKRVAFLDRYAIENYLFVPPVIETVCQNYLGTEEAIVGLHERISDIIKTIESKVLPVIVLDVLNQRVNAGVKSFPDSSLEFFDAATLSLKDDRVSHYVTVTKVALAGNEEREVHKEVTTFVQSRGVVSLLRGHFLFSLVRIFILHILRRAGRKACIDDRGWLLLLCAEVWKRPPTDEHRQLRKRLNLLVAATRRAKARLSAVNGAKAVAPSGA